MKDYKKKYSPQSHRKMYFDVKKELDVARIEQLMNKVSPASPYESSAKASKNSQMNEV